MSGLWILFIPYMKRKSHSKALQKVEFQNFIQPWWSYFKLKRAILEHWRTWNFEIFFNNGKVFSELQRDFRALEEAKFDNFLQPWWSSQIKKETIYRVGKGGIWKFSLIMVNFRNKKRYYRALEKWRMRSLKKFSTMVKFFRTKRKHSTALKKLEFENILQP